MYIFLAILLFSFLIFIHELGHFAAAKLSGVQVNEFALFMGPALLQKQVGETTYSLRCIPLGGYCAMEGEDEESDDPRAFGKAAWWKRLIILVAGAAMNFIAGVLIFALIFMPAGEIAEPVVSSFTDCCIFNNEQGLQLDDRILEIDGEKVYVNSDISLLLSLNPTGVHDLVIRRGEEKIEFHDFAMTHTHLDENGQEYSHYGFGFGKAKTLSFGERIGYVFANVADTVRDVRLSLQMLLTGQASLNDMAGPVRIVDMMSDVAASAESTQAALLNILYFGGFIAINLAVMNLLPIPALDGGRVASLLITTVVEAITKKKINPKYEGYLHGGFMILLMALMVVILFKDILFVMRG